VTVPVTAEPPVAVSVNVEVLIVVAFISWVKVAVRALDTETLVALLAGTVAETVGTGAGAVVKVHV
jgi:hypothetical protein